MRKLLEYLETRTPTLTIFEFTGSDAVRMELTEWLGGYGVSVRTEPTGPDQPTDVAVLHRGDEVLETVTVDALREAMDRDGVDGFEESSSKPELLGALRPDMAVKPSRSVREMVRISRDFERRALREERGRLHSGFQHLSQLTSSKRTMEVYTTLAEKGVDVTVYGYPDTTVEDMPFRVVTDPERVFERHWFLLYDGGGNPNRKAALVSEERPVDEDGQPLDTDATSDRKAEGRYDSYFTVDPDIVDELFEIAQQEYGDVLA